MGLAHCRSLRPTLYPRSWCGAKVGQAPLREPTEARCAPLDLFDTRDFRGNDAGASQAEEQHGRAVEVKIDKGEDGDQWRNHHVADDSQHAPPRVEPLEHETAERKA